MITEVNYGTKRNPSRRTSFRRAAGIKYAGRRIGARTQCSDQPHHGHSQWPARDYCRYGIAARPLVRHKRRILAEFAEALRVAFGGKRKGRGDSEAAKTEARLVSSQRIVLDKWKVCANPRPF